ncbi:hypothetical protein IH781_02995, partial [Patescibacteria group bacterium]|nr:hypothetical protein [Patescibacteria group bacterium]
MFEPGKRESKRQSSAIKADVFSVGTASDKPNIITSPQRGLATVAVSLAVVGIALVGTL